MCHINNHYLHDDALKCRNSYDMYETKLFTSTIKQRINEENDVYLFFFAHEKDTKNYSFSE